MSTSAALALSGRVLVADDLPDAARSLAMLCELYGADVRFTLDGGETVKVAERFLPEVVLMDISMPGMSGYDAARAIRSVPWGREMILIALTGWGRSTDLEQANAVRLAAADHRLRPSRVNAAGRPARGRPASSRCPRRRR